MLEFFTYKKLKKHQDEKTEKQKLEKEKDKGKGKEQKPKGDAVKSSADAIHPESISSPEIILERTEGMPILDLEDEKFLERLTSPSDSNISIGDGDETPPPLPPRIKTPVIELDSDDSSVASKDESKQDVPTKEKHRGKDKDKHDGDKHDHKPKRFSFVTSLSRNISLRRKPTQHLSVPPSSSTPTSLSPSPSEREVSKEETDIARVLEDLNLAASIDNKAFSLSRESAETLRKFTQVLKDLVNGVPTAYNDLVGLIEDRDGILAKSYDKLPSSLKKLVAQLPEKLTSSLAPELLAVAAEAQGLKGAEVMSATRGSKGDAAKKLLGSSNLLELVTKPGAVVGLLKGIVNVLKTRWPAFVGTNVLWSIAVFLLLSALWYCYKRGRETRLEREASEGAGAEREVEAEVLVEGTKEGGNTEANGDVPRIEGVPDQLRQQPTVSVSAPAS
ncbi:hypothetical protein F4813DRAFT_360458 [Daldinia decipiens]|uniref:uncharacterized protein n=1 Tax=Daldinia decipiens TaxID=326647 RepID=UPI0020C2DE5E|nr:uncharacterized protein F4813DRAFT_360458 [Daldinia decipiens]KAI1657563.1 hypothetical protein F4813DRAFT_360458 [Daldinia decipiens]